MQKVYSLTKFFSFILCFTQTSYADLDVFVMGDSQISYSHHHGFELFFKNPKALCGADYPVADFSYAGYGASGSGFHDWVEKTGELNDDFEHGHICNMGDHKKWFGPDLDGSVSETEWGSSIWGGVCEEGARPIEKVLNFQPKIVVASFLGAHTGQDEAEIRKSINEFEANLHENTSCIVVTSPPMMDVLEAIPEEEINSVVRQKKYDEQSRETIERLNKELEIRKRDLIKAGVDPETDEYYLYLKKRLREEESAGKTFRSYLERMYVWAGHRETAADLIHKIVLENRRCHLVEGLSESTQKFLAGDLRNYLSPETLKDFIENDRIYFDPFHLTTKGSVDFFDIKKVGICETFKKASQGIFP